MTRRQGFWVVLGLSLAFFGTWWNRYVPPTTDGEAMLMTEWGRHYLPYRDYFSQAPPGIPMLIQATVAIAGPHLLATLTFGVFLRTAGVCALYAMLLRVSRPNFAALAALTALFVSS